jgi:hypothetical protein
VNQPQDTPQLKIFPWEVPLKVYVVHRYDDNTGKMEKIELLAHFDSIVGQTSVLQFVRVIEDKIFGQRESVVRAFSTWEDYCEVPPPSPSLIVN